MAAYGRGIPLPEQVRVLHSPLMVTVFHAWFGRDHLVLTPGQELQRSVTAQ